MPKAKAERHHEPSALERLEALLDIMKTQATHNAPITPAIIKELEEIVAIGRGHEDAAA